MRIAGQEDLTKKFPNTCASYTLKHVKTGHYYVGSTSNLVKRLRAHRLDLRTRKHHNEALLSSSNWDDIEVYFTEFPTLDLARRAEQLLLDTQWADPLCCNRATGVYGLWGGVYGMPEEIRQAIGNRSRGKVYCDEFRQKCRERMLGTVMPEEQKKKISEALKGKTVSDETRQRLSKALKGKGVGKTITEETKRKILETKRARYGNTWHTEESKAKIAEANYKAVVINGVIYRSLNEAAEKFGMDRRSIAYRVNSPSKRFAEWFWKE